MLNFTTHPELMGVLHVGVGHAAKAIRDAAANIGVACNSCERNIFEQESNPEFKEAAGCGLCAECYEEAGLENAHADGMHEGVYIAECPDCSAT